MDWLHMVEVMAFPIGLVIGYFIGYGLRKDDDNLADKLREIEERLKRD